MQEHATGSAMTWVETKMCIRDSRGFVACVNDFNSYYRANIDSVSYTHLDVYKRQERTDVKQ